MSDKDTRLERAKKLCSDCGVVAVDDAVIFTLMRKFADAECAALEKKLERALELLHFALPYLEAEAEAYHLLDGFGPRKETKQDRILANFRAEIDEIGGGE